MLPAGGGLLAASSIGKEQVIGSLIEGSFDGICRKESLTEEVSELMEIENLKRIIFFCQKL